MKKLVKKAFLKRAFSMRPDQPSPRLTKEQKSILKVRWWWYEEEKSVGQISRSISQPVTSRNWTRLRWLGPLFWLASSSMETSETADGDNKTWCLSADHVWVVGRRRRSSNITDMFTMKRRRVFINFGPDWSDIGPCLYIGDWKIPSND